MGTGILAAIAGLASPILARVLIALGLSVVTITGVSTAVDALKAQVVSYLAAGPVAALQIAGLAGAWQALGIMFGAMTFALAYWSLTKATTLLATA